METVGGWAWAEVGSGEKVVDIGVIAWAAACLLAPSLETLHQLIGPTQVISEFFLFYRPA